MKKLYDLLIKLSDSIFFLEKWLLLLAVVVVVAVNFINVILRYIINSGLAYCETLSICLFMFMVVIGANIAVKSPRKDAVFRLIGDIIAIATIIFCMIGLCATVESVMQHLQRVTPLPIYTYHIYIVMTVGFGLALLDHIIVFIKHILLISGQQVEGGAKTV